MLSQLAKPSRYLSVLCSVFCMHTAFAQPAVKDRNFVPPFLNQGSGGEPLIEDLCRPEYPRASLRNEEAGVAIVQIEVEVTGKVTSAKIVRTSGFRLLDNATIEALRKCVYRPFKKRGVVYKEVKFVQYVWRLD